MDATAGHAAAQQARMDATAGQATEKQAPIIMLLHYIMSYVFSLHAGYVLIQVCFNEATYITSYVFSFSKPAHDYLPLVYIQYFLVVGGGGPVQGQGAQGQN
ncbi:hypothetical protein ACJX0J_019179, partial [Zea mays]